MSQLLHLEYGGSTLRSPSPRRGLDRGAAREGPPSLALPSLATAVPPSTPLPGRVPKDLIELMMIQNSQMHQVLMNSLAVSALTSFGFGPSPATAQALAMPLQSEEEEEAVVFHHHYIPYPGPVPVLPWLDPGRDRGPGAVRFLGSLAEDEVSAVPPPPPPSATGTVGPNVPPASEYYSVLEERL
ncbi:PREDICTED: proline-rich protein 29 [Lepidothrix coronata]|uniref:Proline-rich protein 29 n=1 Tax=Lepidothrix coronata TaxID=321398 RepID=A0A6J0J4H3_9PASS|nr:PREDICTED: proline-rich protein 29 [Lepidothrix coronata]